MFGFDINLEEFPLSDVLQFLVRTKKSGVLRIFGAVTGEIYLKKGLVVHASDGVNKGMEAIINLTFIKLETGRFETNVNAPRQTLDEDFGKLTETIEKRRIEFHKIKKKLPPLDTVFAKSTRELESTVALRRTDWRILALVDGKRKLSDVITDSKIGGYEAAKTITWLKEQGLIYEPQESERVTETLTQFLGIFFEVFGKNGLQLLKKWGQQEARNNKVISACQIDEKTLQMSPNAELSAGEVELSIKNLREYIKTEGSKLYGKVLFNKKWSDFEQKLKRE